MGYAYALAIAQFATLALGLMAVSILTKVDGGERGVSAIAAGLMNIGLLAFLAPLAWIIFALVIVSCRPEKQARRVVSSTGVALILLIVATIWLSLL
ncbi:MAG: hypothetical protein WEB60_11070 [Terrimicrobiaceae bacterium]